MSNSNIILAITIIITALIAGLYYGYSCSVNPGLNQLDDANYIYSMQSINRAIQNGLFFGSFFGVLVLLPLSTYMNYNSPRFVWLLSASIIYAVGSFGVTLGGNVPLNEALDVFNIKTATASEIHAARMNFESKWNSLHRIRTLATFASLALAVISCFMNTIAPQTDN